MDPRVIETLAAAGIETGATAPIPMIAIQVDDEGCVWTLEDEIDLMKNQDEMVEVRLGSIASLFVGNRRAPSFAAGPTREYEPFFSFIEETVRNYCCAAEDVPTDQEV